jgi:hypothetical protein
MSNEILNELCAKMQKHNLYIRASKQHEITKKALCQTKEYDKFIYLTYVCQTILHVIDSCHRITITTSEVKYDENLYFEKAFIILITKIENFFIRINSLNDRLIKLVNVIFDLGYKRINYQLLIGNRHISNNQKIIILLKEIKKILFKHTEKRNILIHERSLFDDDIFETSDLEKIQSIEEAIEHLQQTEMTSQEYIEQYGKNINPLIKIADDKANEYSLINLEIFNRILLLFDVLEIEFDKQLVKHKADLSI